MPRGLSLTELGEVRGLSPGLLSAGIGDVPTAQTYLDIGQGNRVSDSLYNRGLPKRLGGGICGPPYSRAVVARAESAPAEIVPGLLAATLKSAGKSCVVRDVTLRQLPGLIAGLRGEDLLIAIERPPPAKGRALAIGIAGRGFDGNLTSGSTRLDGYVLSTDVAPTVLARLGVAVPSQMSGQPIRAEGRADPAALVSLEDRLAAIMARRGPVLGAALLAWLAALGLLLAASRGRAARRGVRLLGLSVVYLPPALLICPALEPSLGLERLLAIAAPPLLAAATLAALGGWRALAAASGIAVLAYAADAIAGSPLSSLSLLGPDPALGIRFYGIGNELEALLGVLVVAGTGAALSGFAPRLAPRPAAAAFLAAGLVLAFVFAAGSFGADVTAAIVLPLGAAVAAAALAARRGRRLLLAFAVPLAALALIALADLVSGANSHFTRSVLDAAGFHELADVAQRRLGASAASFTRPVVLAFMPLLVAAALLAILGRRRLAAWTEGSPALRAGLLGALAATLAGTLVNDSGALVLEIGAVYLIVFTAYAWAEGTKSAPVHPLPFADQCASPSYRHIPGPTRGA